jgi:hypothetical protein
MTDTTQPSDDFEIDIDHDLAAIRSADYEVARRLFIAVLNVAWHVGGREVLERQIREMALNQPDSIAPADPIILPPVDERH